MSMTRSKIERSITIAEVFITSARRALAQLDKEADERARWRELRATTVPMPMHSDDDYSFGSKRTSEMRRTSMALTRQLAELRR